MDSNREAIGIFDSGIGGLTVLRKIIERLPGESTVYLGDTARVPYGTKSPDTVRRYALACARVLLDQGIKLLVVACNTATAHALEFLQDSLDIPVLGVVEPGARAAAARTVTGRVGVIGTRGTVASGVYDRAIAAIDPTIKVWGHACPLLVPLAEEGWIHGSVPEQVVQSYLSELTRHRIDTLVLGCTHYPMLTDTIQATIGPAVSIVDSAEATAAVVEEILGAADIAAMSGPARHRYLVSDAPDSFAKTGREFLKHSIDDVEWVDF